MATSNRKKRSLSNSILRYSSGLHLRELANHSLNRANYFGLGGINLFSSLMIMLLGILSFTFAFPKMHLSVDLCAGLMFGTLTFFFNRQTIGALNELESQQMGNKWNSITILPALLLAFFLGLLISTPLKFYLFDLPIQESLFKSLKSLNEFTDSSINLKISSWSITLVIILISLFPILIKLSRVQKIENNRSSIINELMWFCAGTNNEILRKCPTEYSKYFGIGGTILFTALMATMSGGYAFYTAFQNATLAILFGIFWGSMIFNLDRYIVNTIYTDGTVRITKGELLAGLPRIIIAIFLGIVISLPLELKLFEDEINVELGTMKRTLLKDSQKDSTFIELIKVEARKKDLESTRNQINNGQYKVLQDQYIKNLIEENASLENSIIILRNKIKPLQSAKTHSDTLQIYYENNITNSNINKNQKEIDKNINEIEELQKAGRGTKEDQLAQINAELKEIELKIQNLSIQKNEIQDAHNKNIIALSGLSARMEAFSNLKDKKTSISIASFFIMMLLIIIEIAPVLFKLMTESGPYDEILKSTRHEVYIREQQKISDINDEINTNIKISAEKNKNKMDAEVKANDELLREIAIAQAEIAKTAIHKWKESELDKVNSDPSCYIKSNQSKS